MAYTNSPLVVYTKLSPNHSGQRNHAIDTITIHCVVGQCSIETLGEIFAPTSRQASSNYGIGSDGRVGMYVEEKNRSWCTSSSANDHRAITIEVASDTTHPYAVNDKAFAALLDLVTDICMRNGIKQLVWSTDKTQRVNHLNGCNMTVHRDYANKSCPGQYLYDRHGKIAEKVNERLNAASEPVKVFVPRLTRPEAGNKYYITKSKGGYSEAISGKPTDKDCDVLSNCVGYAYGRFNEIGGWGSCKYLYPTNAENFIQYKGNLEVGMEPRIGACMVWQKGDSLSGSDGAGHVAIVEEILGKDELKTSESGWGSTTPFWTKTRKKGDGNWGAGSAYKFLGFIYNPAPCCANNSVPEDEPVAPTPAKISEGDIVKIAENAVYYNGKTVPAWVKAKEWYVDDVDGDRAVIDRSVDGKNAICSPINTKYLTVVKPAQNGSQGAEKVKLEKGVVITFTGKKHYSSANSKTAVPCKPGKATITLDPYLKGKHPYHLVAVKGGTSNVYGWVDAEDIYEAQEHHTEEFTPYLVKITASALNIRKAAGVSNPIVGCIKDRGIYTIVDEDNGWGKLKSGAGWISLAYTERV